jgi:alkylation response protein AidB-like acyl-CoA dehydrogenase
MSFVLTEEQLSIQRTARDLVRERAPVSQFRALRDARDADGFSRALWTELAELGLVGVSIPEAYGGAGLGHAELGLVLEQLGRTLAPTPLLSTIALGANALVLGDSEALREQLLPGVCAGDTLLAFACDEGTRFDPAAIETTATRAGDDVAIRGEKSHVLDAHVADHILVAAHFEGELAIFAVPASTPGIRIERVTNVDHRNAARVRFDDVTVPASARVGGAAVLDRVLDRATIALAAEMLGGIQQAFDDTLAYLKTRKQFGVPIGSFQALKHRAATMFCEVELTKSIIAHALRAIDADKPDLPRLASTAKARTNDTYDLVSAEAVQMHGGVGVTDELDIGFHLKRARVAAMTLGTSVYHRSRYWGRS